MSKKLRLKSCYSLPLLLMAFFSLFGSGSLKAADIVFDSNSFYPSNTPYYFTPTTDGVLKWVCTENVVSSDGSTFMYEEGGSALIPTDSDMSDWNGMVDVSWAEYNLTANKTYYFKWTKSNTDEEYGVLFTWAPSGNTPGTGGGDDGGDTPTSWPAIDFNQTYSVTGVGSVLLSYTPTTNGTLTVNQDNDDNHIFVGSEPTYSDEFSQWVGTTFPSTSIDGYTLTYGLQANVTYYVVAKLNTYDGITSMSFAWDPEDASKYPQIVLGETYTVKGSDEKMVWTATGNGVLSVQTNVWSNVANAALNQQYFLWTTDACSTNVTALSVDDGDGGLLIKFEVTEGTSYYLWNDDFTAASFTFTFNEGEEVVPTLVTVEPSPGTAFDFVNYPYWWTMIFSPTQASCSNATLTYTTSTGESKTVNVVAKMNDSNTAFGISVEELSAAVAEGLQANSFVTFTLTGVEADGHVVTACDVNSPYVTVDNGTITVQFSTGSAIKYLSGSSTYPNPLLSYYPVGSQEGIATIVFDGPVGKVDEFKVVEGRVVVGDTGGETEKASVVIPEGNITVSGNHVQINFAGLNLSSLSGSTVTLMGSVWGENGLMAQFGTQQIMTEYLSFEKVEAPEPAEPVVTKGSYEGVHVQEGVNYPYTLDYSFAYNENGTITATASYTWTEQTPVGATADVTISYPENVNLASGATTEKTYEEGETVSVVAWIAVMGGRLETTINYTVGQSATVDAPEQPEPEQPTGTYYTVVGNVFADGSTSMNMTQEGDLWTLTATLLPNQKFYIQQYEDGAEGAKVGAYSTQNPIMYLNDQLYAEIYDPSNLFWAEWILDSSICSAEGTELTLVLDTTESQWWFTVKAGEEEGPEIGDVTYNLFIEGEQLSDGEDDYYTEVEPGFQEITVYAGDETVALGPKDNYGNSPLQFITIYNVNDLETTVGGVDSFNNGVLKLNDPFTATGKFVIKVGAGVFEINGVLAPAAEFYFTTGEGVEYVKVNLSVNGTELNPQDPETVTGAVTAINVTAEDAGTLELAGELNDIVLTLIGAAGEGDDDQEVAQDKVLENAFSGYENGVLSIAPGIIAQAGEYKVYVPEGMFTVDGKVSYDVTGLFIVETVETPAPGTEVISVNPEPGSVLEAEDGQVLITVDFSATISNLTGSAVVGEDTYNVTVSANGPSNDSFDVIAGSDAVNAALATDDKTITFELTAVDQNGEKVMYEGSDVISLEYTVNGTIISGEAATIVSIIPEGDEISLQADGSAEITIEFSAPVTIDADGTYVPLEFSMETMSYTKAPVTYEAQDENNTIWLFTVPASSVEEGMQYTPGQVNVTIKAIGPDGEPVERDGSSSIILNYTVVSDDAVTVKEITPENNSNINPGAGEDFSFEITFTGDVKINSAMAGPRGNIQMTYEPVPANNSEYASVWNFTFPTSYVQEVRDGAIDDPESEIVAQLVATITAEDEEGNEVLVDGSEYINVTYPVVIESYGVDFNVVTPTEVEGSFNSFNVTPLEGYSTIVGYDNNANYPNCLQGIQILNSNGEVVANGVSAAVESDGSAEEGDTPDYEAGETGVIYFAPAITESGTYTIKFPYHALEITKAGDMTDSNFNSVEKEYTFTVTVTNSDEPTPSGNELVLDDDEFQPEADVKYYYTPAEDGYLTWTFSETMVPPFGLYTADGEEVTPVDTDIKDNGMGFGIYQGTFAVYPVTAGDEYYFIWGKNQCNALFTFSTEYDGGDEPGPEPGEAPVIYMATAEYSMYMQPADNDPELSYDEATNTYTISFDLNTSEYTWSHALYSKKDDGTYVSYGLKGQYGGAEWSVDATQYDETYTNTQVSVFDVATLGDGASFNLTRQSLNSGNLTFTLDLNSMQMTLKLTNGGSTPEPETGAFIETIVPQQGDAYAISLDQPQITLTEEATEKGVESITAVLYNLGQEVASFDLVYNPRMGVWMPMNSEEDVLLYEGKEYELKVTITYEDGSVDNESIFYNGLEPSDTPEPALPEAWLVSPYYPNQEQVPGIQVAWGAYCPLAFVNEDVTSYGTVLIPGEQTPRSYPLVIVDNVPGEEGGGTGSGSGYPNTVNFNKFYDGDPMEGTAHAFSIPGDYVITIPANLFFVTVDGVQIPNKEVQIVYHCGGEGSDLGNATATPENGTYVPALDVVFLNWGEPVSLVEEPTTVEVRINGEIAGEAPVTIYEGLLDGGIFSTYAAGDDINYAMVDLSELVDYNTTGVVTFVVPAGMVQNEEGATNSVQSFEYTILALSYADQWTPDFTEVDKVANTEQITISWSDAVIEFNPFASTTAITATNQATNGVVYFSDGDGLTLENNNLVLDLSRIEEEGVYNFSVPQGLVLVGDDMMNAETDATYTVTVGSEEVKYWTAPYVMVTPESDIQPSLGPVTIMWDMYYDLELVDGAVAQLYHSDAALELGDLIDDAVEVNVMNATPAPETGEEGFDYPSDVYNKINGLVFSPDFFAVWGMTGTFTFVLPAGSVMNQYGEVNPEAMAIIHVVPAWTGAMEVTPECPNYESVTVNQLPYITISFPGAEAVSVNEGVEIRLDSQYGQNNINVSDRITNIVTDENGNEIGIEFYVADLAEEIGTYTLVVPEGAFTIMANGEIYVNGVEGYYEFTTTEVTVGVNSIVGAQEGRYVVYNMNGVLLLNTENEADLQLLQPGLYIINGKKVLIRK